MQQGNPPPPPSYPPQQPPPAVPPKGKSHKLLYGCGGLVVLIVVLVIISMAISGGSKSSTNPPPSKSTTSKATPAPHFSSQVHWSQSSNLEPDGSGQLSTVACSSTTSFCMIGDSNAKASVWSGHGWTSVTSPPSGNDFFQLSCVNSQFCMSINPQDGQVLTWNGSAWRQSLSMANGTDNLGSVSCASTTYCAVFFSTAAYTCGTCSGATLPYAAQTWNGTSWSSPQVVGKFQANTALYTSCSTSSNCMVIDGAGNYAYLSGGSWSRVGDFQPATTSTHPIIAGLSCVGVGFCVTADVGGYAYEWNGSAWNSGQIFDLTSSTPVAVACSSSTFCEAIDPTNAFQWNGSSWSKAIAVDSHGGLIDLSCAASSACVAIDQNGYVYLGQGA